MIKLVVGAYSCNLRPVGLEDSWGLLFSIAKSVSSRSRDPVSKIKCVYLLKPFDPPSLAPPSTYQGQKLEQRTFPMDRGGQQGLGLQLPMGVQAVPEV